MSKRFAEVGDVLRAIIYGDEGHFRIRVIDAVVEAEAATLEKLAEEVSERVHYFMQNGALEIKTPSDKDLRHYDRANRDIPTKGQDIWGTTTIKIRPRDEVMEAEDEA